MFPHSNIEGGPFGPHHRGPHRRGRGRQDAASGDEHGEGGLNDWREVMRERMAEHMSEGRGGPKGERRGGRGEGRGEGRGGRGEGRGPRGRGFGRPGGWQNVDLPPADDAQSWFEGRLPEGWFSAVEVNVDREELIVVGTLRSDEDAADAGVERATAEGRVSRFRADTRADRIQIAEEAQARYGRKVSWGARLGEVDELFTHVSVPVMTRLRQPERQVLDTLVDAGVARSRSEALAWAVKLVGEHTESWLSGLREAMAEVDKLRAQGPEL